VADFEAKWPNLPEKRVSASGMQPAHHLAEPEACRRETDRTLWVGTGHLPRAHKTKRCNSHECAAEQNGGDAHP
jgi:hypothetical protein